MPITETLLTGAAGGFGGVLAGQALQPITSKFNDWHRIALLLLIVGAIITFFVILPPRKRRRAP